MATTEPHPIGPNPAISVVVPAHNSSRWIEATLTSVAAQSIDADLFEIIVVDDGSTDDTAEIAERFLGAGSTQWTLVRQANAGPSRARNVGVQIARGSWIQFLDADDLLDPEKLKIQWEFASEASAEAAVIISPWRKFGSIDTRFETGDVITPRFRGNVIDELFSESVSIATGSQLYRKDWLNRVGGWNEAHTNGEDHELSLRVAFAGGRFVEAPAAGPLFFYRREGGSLSSRSGRKNAEVWPRLAKMIEDESRARNELTPERLARIVNIYGGAARWLADSDWPAASALISRVFELDPNYIPNWSRKFRFLSAVVGFRNAVRLGAWLRPLYARWTSAPRLTQVAGPVFPRPSPENESMQKVLS